MQPLQFEALISFCVKCDWGCSTAAPEVLSGGPYNHAADWWSLGILLFSLTTGKVQGNIRHQYNVCFNVFTKDSFFCDCIFQFPVLPEPDHCSMLRKVRSFPYEMPLSFSPQLSLLLSEVIWPNTIIFLSDLGLLIPITPGSPPSFYARLRPAAWELSIVSNDRPSSTNQHLTLSLCSVAPWR